MVLIFLSYTAHTNSNNNTESTLRGFVYKILLRSLPHHSPPKKSILSCNVRIKFFYSLNYVLLKNPEVYLEKHYHRNISFKIWHCVASTQISVMDCTVFFFEPCTLFFIINAIIWNFVVWVLKIWKLFIYK